jgi:hypothetical protein
LDLYAPARDNHNGRSGATHPDSRGIVFHLKARQVYGFFKPIPIKTIDGTRVYFNDVTNPMNTTPPFSTPSPAIYGIDVRGSWFRRVETEMPPGGTAVLV